VFLWLKKNLFSNGFNTLLTLVSVIFIYQVIWPLIFWSLTLAQWQVIGANFRLFFVGYYPEALLWRIWLSLSVLAAMTGLSWGVLSPTKHRSFTFFITFLATASLSLFPVVGLQSSLLLLGNVALLGLTKWLGSGLVFLVRWLSIIWPMTFFLVLWLLQGGIFLEPVSYNQFSGLILTILVALVSIVLSFPLGVLLAVGRQSQLLVIRWLSIAYIEIIRGLPLIGILFIAQVLLPLILPRNIRLDSMLRVIAGFTIFSSAYLAENVRGGLQSIPRGQTEAAKALGLNPILVLMLVILPQALRAVIPTIVGQFISLFKDTSLLSMVGLVDLLGISQSILGNPKYQGRNVEVYLFLGFIYWFFCSLMAWGSRQLEQKA
jgi:general L-amino acid transport system permease protein